MPEHRHNWSSRRVRCSSCGSSDGFAPLRDNDDYGHCFACGYKNYPSSTLNESYALPLMRKKAKPDEHYVPNIVPDQSVIDRSLVYLAEIPDDPDRECTAEEERAAIMEYDGHMSRDQAERLAGLHARPPSIDEMAFLRLLNPFAATLVEMTRPHILIDWHVGKDHDGAILFWYRNIDGQFVNAKRIVIGPDGFHRNNEVDPRFLYKGASPCLFGEHQLSPKFKNHMGSAYNRSSPIVLVESEKTAVIMSHHIPGNLWLATGGAQALTKSKAKVLRGRSVTILFDLDTGGIQGSRKTEKILSEVGARPHLLDPAILFPGKPQGYDIADSIYEEFLAKGTING